LEILTGMDDYPLMATRVSGHTRFPFFMNY
jgi:hypothetical protein